MVKKVPALKGRKVVYSLKTDYAWRLFINETELSILMQFLVLNLDYSNFKDTVKHTKDQADKVPHYLDIWGTMFDYQVEDEKRQYRKKFRYRDYEEADDIGWTDLRS